MEDKQFKVIFDINHIVFPERSKHLSNAWTFVLKTKVTHELVLLFLQVLLKLVKGRCLIILSSLIRYIRFFTLRYLFLDLLVLLVN